VKITGPKRYRPITTYAMEAALVKDDAPFYFRNWVALPRANWGLPGICHETDLLCLKRNEKVLVEVEIKISVGDFKADFKKNHHHESDIISALYYAVPAEMAAYVQNNIPEGVGLISVDYEERAHIVVPANYKKKNPPGDICVQRIYAYIAMRYWSERIKDTRAEFISIGNSKTKTDLGQIKLGQHCWTITERDNFSNPSKIELNLSTEWKIKANASKGFVSVWGPDSQYAQTEIAILTLEDFCDKALMFYTQTNKG
jgi:hypothetical protein